MNKSDFQKLYELDVNHKTKDKNGLKYLSWAWAWAEFKKANPIATYVVDGANAAMKAEAYTYKTRYKEKECEAATMFDINTAIMRCLTKNLAMFGLGLYIYAGEDMPSVDNSEEIEMAEIMSWVDAIRNNQTTIDDPNLRAEYKKRVEELL